MNTIVVFLIGIVAAVVIVGSFIKSSMEGKEEYNLEQPHCLAPSKNQ